MRDWKQVAVAADIAIFFCAPHSAADLDWVAAELNDRPATARLPQTDRANGELLQA